ncbi:CAAX prenyl protease 2 [Clonorchis sinensis]|uniref:CAAX prenyl protease 2 n=1 Tax=Clonorchis sinensis TaxID=79923 RepID=A0A8T1LZE5_CLOSI|nr:CAAX prenyl protease 2 [Clonorchis sinensis]
MMPEWATLYCLAYAVLFIVGLYFCGSNYSRNHPTTIRNRFLSISFVCALIMCHISRFIHKPGYSLLDPYAYQWHKVFIRLDHLWESISVPFILTLILYLGTIVDDLCCGRTSLIFDRYFWETRFFHLVGVRNLLVAPLAEELIFRACIIFHLQRLYPSCHELCIISPLFFSIAHFHHIYERVYDGESLRKAFLSALFQVGYTTIFGAYSGFLMLRTGNILSAVVAHSLCNFMGLPDPMGAIERAKYRWGLLGQLLAIGAHVGGIVLWGLNLYSMTEPELFGNRSYICYW